jgi:hypothetical protein
MEAIENSNWSREQELGLLCCIIMQESIVHGTLFQTYDKVFEIAKAFIDKYGVDNDTQWGIENDMDYEETVILFAVKYNDSNFL